MKRIVVTAMDVLETSVSGRGMRALGIAGALAQDHRVTLICRGKPGHGMPPGVDLAVSPSEREAALAWANVVVTANEISPRETLRFRGHLVADLYDPRLLELLVASLPVRQRRALLHQELRIQRRLWRDADLVLCATVQQRDLYLGACLRALPSRRLLEASARTLKERVVVVPNGIDPEPPQPDDEARHRLGLTASDTLLVWGGGVWDWTDPMLVHEAATHASREAPGLHVLFLGVQREGRLQPMAARNANLLRTKADGNGPTLVLEEWLDARARGGVLLACDAGVFAQHPGLEAHFSFRQRFIDCLWAGLPIITTDGDPLSAQAASRGWGLVSASGDAVRLADNLVRFARDPTLRAALRAAANAERERWTWKAVVDPLARAIDGLPTSGRVRRAWRGAEAIPAAAWSKARASITESARLRPLREKMGPAPRPQLHDREGGEPA